MSRREKAHTTDPTIELNSKMGLGGMRLCLLRIQVEVRRLQNMRSEDLNDTEARRLAAYYEVLNDPDLDGPSRSWSLYRNPIFEAVIYTGNSP